MPMGEEVERVLSNLTEGERMKVYDSFFTAVTRRALGNRIDGSVTYDGKRDMYKVLGYKKNLCFADFYAKYKRLDIAAAVVDTQVETSFHGGFSVYEGERDEDETEFEKAYKEIDEKFNFSGIFSRADTLAMLGQYSGILLGLSDVQRVEELKMEPGDSKKDLLYIRPVPEDFLEIAEVSSNPLEPRYTLPETYDISSLGPSGTAGYKSKKMNVGDEISTYRFHADRVIHIAYNPLENELYGTPVLEKSYNTLDNIEKIVGGAAEMFWRGARPGYMAQVDNEHSYSDEMKKVFLEQLSKYENDLSRVIVGEGVKMEDLAQQIEEPTGAFIINVQLLCAAQKIPMRILLGSERGELASTQDRSTWHERIEGRRVEKLEKMILRPTIDRLISVGVLPEPEMPYNIYWADLMSLSEREKAEIGKLKSDAFKNYLTVPGAARIIPPDMFAKLFLYFEQGHIDRMMSELDQAVLDEIARGGDDDGGATSNMNM